LIQYLPPELGILPNLTYLNISGNPLNTLPEGLRNAPLSELATYLAKLKKIQESWSLRKIVVIGPDGAGKSSLIKGLQSRDPTRKSLFIRASLGVFPKSLSDTEHMRFNGLTITEKVRLYPKFSYATGTFWEIGTCKFK
jgi:hypothetical protein